MDLAGFSPFDNENLRVPAAVYNRKPSPLSTPAEVSDAPAADLSDACFDYLRRYPASARDSPCLLSRAAIPQVRVPRAKPNPCSQIIQITRITPVTPSVICVNPRNQRTIKNTLTPWRGGTAAQGLKGRGAVPIRDETPGKPEFPA
jgi:hypothetical protein